MSEYKVEHDAAKGWWFIRFGDGVKRYSERGYAEVACDAANTALASANARVEAWKAEAELTRLAIDIGFDDGQNTPTYQAARAHTDRIESESAHLKGTP